jgi:hypothetical protein
MHGVNSVEWNSSLYKSFKTEIYLQFSYYNTYVFSTQCICLFLMIITTNNHHLESLGFHMIVVEDPFLFGYDTASLVNLFPTFRRKILPSPSRSIGRSLIKTSALYCQTLWEQIICRRGFTSQKNGVVNHYFPTENSPSNFSNGRKCALSEVGTEFL